MFYRNYYYACFNRVYCLRWFTYWSTLFNAVAVIQKFSSENLHQAGDSRNNGLFYSVALILLSKNRFIQREEARVL